MKTKSWRIQRTFYLVAVSIFMVMLSYGISVHAANSENTKIQLKVEAKGIYQNWEGVSNVSSFLDEQGNYCFAYYKGRTITIVKTKSGKVKSRIKIKMQYPLFGAVTCDPDGNFYVVTGRKNNEEWDQKKNTIFISKYTKKGKLIQTTGDNGSGCFKKIKAYYGEDKYVDYSSNTQEPFAAGNCDIAVNGNYVAVNYARHMYNGHQSNTAVVLNRHTMQFLQMDDYYNSHSFAQRAIPYQDGFIFASEGDAYQRAFSIAFLTPTEEKMTDEEYEAYYRSHEDQMNNWGEKPYYEQIEDARASYTGTEWTSVRNYDLFHFWIRQNKAGDMYVVNNNFAHMGGIAVADNNHVALVGTSAKALDKKAERQKESLFIQIFDPTVDLREESSYAINTKRSGKSGIMGTDSVTDYGIRWLTDGKFEVKNPQVVADHKGRFVVLFEKYSGGRSQGVFYCIINKNGKTSKKITRFAADACLNPCEMPKFAGKTVFWTANKQGSNALVTYKLKIK